jgi:hypothetical protein
MHDTNQHSVADTAKYVQWSDCRSSACCHSLEYPEMILSYWSQAPRSGLVSGLWTGSDWWRAGRSGVRPKEVEFTVNPTNSSAIQLLTCIRPNSTPLSKQNAL